MTKPNEKLVEFPRQSARDILTDVLRDGAQQMLAPAIEAEGDDYLAGRASTVDAAGRRYVVRNGHLRRWCADAGRPTRFKPSSPSPTDAVRDGSAKLGHPVQNVTREHGLTPLPR